MLLIGSRATLVHFPDARPAKDWDVVVDDDEFERLSPLFGKPLREPFKGTYLYRREGVQYEIKRARHLPLWAAVIDRAPMPDEGECSRSFPVLGECRVASPPLLLILKQCYIAYPILHWRKSLIDYHFLKDRIQVVPPHMLEISRIAVEAAKEAFGHLFEPKGDATLTCSNPARRLGDSARHARLHHFFRRSESPLVEVTDAWQGFLSRPVADRRELMIELLVEETLVIARECVEDSSGETAEPHRLCNWALRSLITRYLPLAWRYFAADHFPQIQARFMADARVHEFVTAKASKA